MEFVVSNHIKVHPMALVHYEGLKDAKAKTQIAELTEGRSRSLRGPARLASRRKPCPMTGPTMQQRAKATRSRAARLSGG
jgi:pyruvate,water dikinase